ncbi:nuclear transport factor 2 family protein [Vitiosangium sp. GDMCC 1.1324]|uniref:nuclear transport factor 2 family protein n=1 Tax=Vitiosangium sp. (strain GDMCC 1.1324) TaxID=2138576 RepID=UPI000D36A6AA|nr:nuclear transport factor 2 family protein [Vitiosangium sp. GDMCC 1.1324]PTL76015.1 nuclear transport factor 2 family protein [Vitiosangium sp. GDMCC 1.1324]
MSQTNLETARRYLRALEEGKTGDAMLAFFHPEVMQREYPNRLVPSGVTRDLRGLIESGEKGQKVVSSQRFEVKHTVAEGDHVALRVEWSATLKVPIGSLPIGGTMRASFGVFLSFRDGRIIEQHNYDCFEPF